MAARGIQKTVNRFMSRSSIVYSREAERDLEELFAYIATDSGVQRAELVLRRIAKTLDTLAEWPFIGRLHHEFDGATRTFAVWPWIIFYEPQTGGGIVVWRIVDGRRNLPSVVGS